MNEWLQSLLEQGSLAAAPRLLGARLVTDIGGDRTSVCLNEVEAYGGADDPASHAYRGRTDRNAAMYLPAGHLYVYRSYGIHWCANIVTGPVDVGQAILLRGGLAHTGTPVMQRRRGRVENLTDGPGKLTQAMGIDGSLDGFDLLGATAGGAPIWLEPGDPFSVVRAGPRIGISRATDRPWRFVGGDT